MRRRHVHSASNRVISRQTFPSNKIASIALPWVSASVPVPGGGAQLFRMRQIAIRLGPVERAACGEQPRFVFCRLHQPENSDVWRLALSCSVHAVTRPSARARYVVGLPSCASAFSRSYLTPSASAGRAPRIPAAHVDIFSDPPMLLKERGFLVSRRGRTLTLGPFVVLQIEQDWLGLLGRLALLAAQFENIAPQVPLILQDQVPRLPHATVSSSDSVRARPRK